MSLALRRYSAEQLSPPPYGVPPVVLAGKGMVAAITRASDRADKSAHARTATRVKYSSQR